MYLKYLTREQFYEFLKSEHKYTGITIVGIKRDKENAVVNLDVIITNMDGLEFKCKAVFTDFKCQIIETCINRVHITYDKKWIDWMIKELSRLELRSDKPILVKGYKKAYESYIASKKELAV